MPKDAVPMAYARVTAGGGERQGGDEGGATDYLFLYRQCNGTGDQGRKETEALIARVLESMRRPPILLTAEELREAEGESV